MQNKVNYTIVGLFVIGLTIMLVALILMLSHKGNGKAYKHYMVHMREAVSGLNPQAPVKFNGVKVGEVADISLDPDDLQTVHVLLKIDEDVPITEGTRAVLLAQGITGITYIGLKIIIPHQPLLKRKSGQNYPVILSEPSLLSHVDIAFRELSVDARKLIDHLNHLFDEDTRNMLKQNLDNMQQVTQVIADNRAELNQMLKNSEHITQQTQAALQQLSAQILPSFAAMLDQFNQVLMNTRQITEELKQNPSLLLRGKAPSPPGPGEH